VLSRARPARALLAFLVFTPGLNAAAIAARVPIPLAEQVLTRAAERPTEFRYVAYPTLLRTGPDEVWLAFKAGRSFTPEAGAAMEIVRHTLSTGETHLIQRLPAPSPKLYQMGELARLPDGAVVLAVDVLAIGWDRRHYRTGAEVFRWDPARGAFGPPAVQAPVSGILYGYPLEFVSAGEVTWQLVNAFGYNQPSGRWSMDVLRSADAGRSWSFVRDLAAEFGGLHVNEGGFARHGDGFLVATRGFDRVARLHRTDADFRLLRQVDLTGRHPLIHDIIARPRIWVRDGRGYLLGRNSTRPPFEEGPGRWVTPPQQLCLLRFDPESLAVDDVVLLDNAGSARVTDGYYAVATSSGEGAAELLHVFTYRVQNGRPPEIVRLDFRWADVR